MSNAAFKEWLRENPIEPQVCNFDYVETTAGRAWQAATRHTLHLVAKYLCNMIDQVGENRPDIAMRVLELKP